MNPLGLQTSVTGAEERAPSYRQDSSGFAHGAAACGLIEYEFTAIKGLARPTAMFEPALHRVD
jgi:hypothetical protein